MLHVWEWQKPDEGIGCPGAGVIGSGESSIVGSRNQIQVQCS